MIKEKQCKGQGHAKGHGCGKITKVENRVYGLGKMCGCYSDWLLNSELGKIKLAKSQVIRPTKAAGNDLTRVYFSRAVPVEALPS